MIRPLVEIRRAAQSADTARRLRGSDAYAARAVETRNRRGSSTRRCCLRLDGETPSARLAKRNKPLRCRPLEGRRDQKSPSVVASSYVPRGERGSPVFPPAAGCCRVRCRHPDRRLGAPARPASILKPWRLSGLLSGCPPTGTRPQARAKLGKGADRVSLPFAQEKTWGRMHAPGPTPTRRPSENLSAAGLGVASWFKEPFPKSRERDAGSPAFGRRVTSLVCQVPPGVPCRGVVPGSRSGCPRAPSRLAVAALRACVVTAQLSRTFREGRRSGVFAGTRPRERMASTLNQERPCGSFRAPRFAPWGWPGAEGTVSSACLDPAPRRCHARGSATHRSPSPSPRRRPALVQADRPPRRRQEQRYRNLF